MSPEARKVTVQVEGRALTLSNLDKVLYPEAGFTKAQVIDYYQQIAPVLLPHIAGRAVTIKRYPDGVDGNFFCQNPCLRRRCSQPGCGWLGAKTGPWQRRLQRDRGSAQHADGGGSRPRAVGPCHGGAAVTPQVLP